MVFHSSETWVNITRKTIKILTNFCNMFLRTIFRIETGCPIMNLYWQSGSLLVENIILKNQMMFYHHLANLPSDCLAAEVFSLQVTHSLPGLATQIKEHIQNLGINPVSVSKRVWKKKVYNYINTLNREQLLSNIKKYKKLNYNDFCQEKFERKEYFYIHKLEDVRALVRISSRMLETVRGDFPNKYRKKSLVCPSCCPEVNQPTNKQSDEGKTGPIDTLEHIQFNCEAFNELRAQYDLSDDLQLIQFFKSVDEHRKERGED